MRHAKVDTVHAALIHVARKMGWSAASTAAVGNGYPDASLATRDVCPYCGRSALLLVEFKTGKSAALTPAQKRFHASWRGPIAIVRTVDDLIALLKTAVGPRC